MRHNVARIHHDARCASRSIRRQTNLDRRTRGGHLERPEHELRHVLLVGLEVDRSSREPDQMFLRHNPELVGEGVVPNVLQVIPSHDEIVRNGKLQCRDADLICVPPST